MTSKQSRFPTSKRSTYLLDRKSKCSHHKSDKHSIFGQTSNRLHSTKMKPAKRLVYGRSKKSTSSDSKTKSARRTRTHSLTTSRRGSHKSRKSYKIPSRRRTTSSTSASSSSSSSSSSSTTSSSSDQHYSRRSKKPLAAQDRRTSRARFGTSWRQQNQRRAGEPFSSWNLDRRTSNNLPNHVSSQEHGDTDEFQNVPMPMPAPAPELRIDTSTQLQMGTVGESYSGNMLAVGGALPYTWIIASGTLPLGLALNATSGQITGTPSIAGSFAIGVKVMDARRTFFQNSFGVTIRPAPPALRLMSTNLPFAIAGESYASLLSAAGGVAPYKWSLYAPNPEGSSVDPVTGNLSGKFSTSGTQKVGVQIQDAAGTTIRTSATLSVLPPRPLMVVSSNSLPSAEVNDPPMTYTATLKASGGVPPYTWSLPSGMLPPTLVLSTDSSGNGVISGLVDASGMFSQVIQVKDSTGYVAQKTMQLAVFPKLAVTIHDLPEARVKSFYSTMLIALGGVNPYIWTVSSGALPPGLLLGTDGLLSGIPSSSGTFSFNVQVRDQLLVTVQLTLSLIVQ